MGGDREQTGFGSHTGFAVNTAIIIIFIFDFFLVDWDVQINHCIFVKHPPKIIRNVA